MERDHALRDMERKVYHSTVNDGLADIRAGYLLSILAVAPFFSTRLGDFWSTVMWLPMVIAAEAAIRWTKHHVVVPRLGSVRFGPERKARMARIMKILLAANVLFFIAGIVSSVGFSGGHRPSPWGVMAGVSMFLLAVFTVVGLTLQLNRFFIYGIGTALAYLAGEWLFWRGAVPHHGYPVSFGASGIVLIGIGACLFSLFLRRHPLRPEGENHGDR